MVEDLSLSFQLIPLGSHVVERPLNGLLTQDAFVDLGTGEDVPGAVPGGQAFLGARQLGLLLDRGNIAPLAEGVDDILVIEQRQLGKAQTVLDRPALDH